jgi:putative Holliday junction resolvase
MEERILGIDYGRKRIGVAIADPLIRVASPLMTIKEKEIEKTIMDTLNEYEINIIVVGYPVRTDGKRGKRAKEVENFAENLRRKFNIEVELWDERYTTMEAEKTMREMGKKPSKNKKKVDRIAASLILQSYLDSRNG